MQIFRNRRKCWWFGNFAKKCQTSFHRFLIASYHASHDAYLRRFMPVMSTTRFLRNKKNGTWETKNRLMLRKRKKWRKKTEQKLNRKFSAQVGLVNAFASITSGKRTNNIVKYVFRCLHQHQVCGSSDRFFSFASRGSETKYFNASGSVYFRVKCGQVRSDS